MIINVTENDIRAGIPEDCHSCPVALALVRQCQCEGAEISDDLTLHFPGLKMEFDLPDTVASFIKAFDKGEDVVPFSFTLAVPECFKCST